MHKEYRTYLGLNFTKKFRSFCNFQQGRGSSRLEIFMFNKKYICYFTRLFNILNQVLICIEQKNGMRQSGGRLQLTYLHNILNGKKK